MSASTPSPSPGAVYRDTRAKHCAHVKVLGVSAQTVRYIRLGKPSGSGAKLGLRAFLGIFEAVRDGR